MSIFTSCNLSMLWCWYFCMPVVTIECLHCVYRMLFHTFLVKLEPEQLHWNHAGLWISCLCSHCVLQVEIWFTEVWLWNSTTYRKHSLRFMWGCSSTQWENSTASFTFWSPATWDPRTWNRLCDVMMSRCLWHHMGLITEKGKGVERGVKLAGEVVWVFFSLSRTEQSRVCVQDRLGLVCVCVCVCVCVFSCGRATLVPQTPSRDSLQPENNGSFNRLHSAHTHTHTHTLTHSHTHTYKHSHTFIHTPSSTQLVVFALNPISSSLISWLDWSCGAALFTGEKRLFKFNCCLFSSFKVWFLFCFSPTCLICDSVSF